MLKQISIIIVTYNSEKLIFDCLDSIYKHNDIGSELEIIIVDNCSKDRERVFAKIRSDYPSDIILIKSDVNGGYGHGNNQGVQMCSAERFVIMNPDVRLVEPILKKLLAKFDNTDSIGMMGVNFVDGSRNLYFKPEYSTLIRMIFDSLIVRFRFFKIEQTFFSGSFLIFNKQAFTEAGYFDENIFLYHEEADISNRILQANYKTILAPEIKVLHLAHGRDVNEYLLKVGSESRKYYFDKYGANLNKYYYNKLIIYRIKYLLAFLIGNRSKVKEFSAWIKMCKNNGIV